MWLVGFAGAAAQAQTITLDIPHVMALAESRSVQAITAEKRVQQALARISESRSTFFPQLTGTASQNRKTVNLRAVGIPIPGDPLLGPYNVFDARLRLTQTLLDAGAYERLRQARLGEALSMAEQQKARQDATVLALTLFINARRSEESLTAARAFLARDEKALQIAEERLRNGSGTPLDVADLSADVSQSRQRIAQAETRRTENRLDLLALLGLPLDTAVVFSTPAAATAPEPLADDLLLTQTSRHPDVLVASITVLSRRADERIARADYFPLVQAVGDFGASGNEPDDSLATYNFGGQLSLPIFEGGRRASRARLARRAREEGEARLADTRLQVEARARLAQVALEQNWALIQAADSDRAAAQRQLRAAETRLRVGQGTSYEELERRTTLIRTEDAWQEAVAAYELARVQKAAALGRLDLLKEEGSRL